MPCHIIMDSVTGYALDHCVSISWYTLCISRKHIAYQMADYRPNIAIVNAQNIMMALLPFYVYFG